MSETGWGESTGTTQTTTEANELLMASVGVSVGVMVTFRGA